MSIKMQRVKSCEFECVRERRNFAMAGLVDVGNALTDESGVWKI